MIDWMLNPINDDTLKAWMKENWDLLSAYNTGEEPDIEKIWFKLQESIKNEKAGKLISFSHSKIDKKGLLPKRLFPYFAAASVIIFFIVSGFLYNYFNELRPDDNLAAYGKNVIVEENKETPPKTISLEDGTKVTLSAKSVFYYPTHFINGKREVALRGTAFFDVAKNPEKPFFVYANNVVTKVLGTSFTIQTDLLTKEVSVSVKTGRVQVFEKNSASKSTFNSKVLTSNGVIITANQKAVYSNKKNDFQTTLVPEPLPLPNLKSTEKLFEFNRASISLVLEKIQNAYGVEIVLENDSFNNCTFSGELDEESLFEKLDIICTAINATYEVSGTKILIKGTGCK